MYDDVWSKVFSNHQLRDYLFKLNSCDVMKDFNFKYQTSDEFNDSTLSIKDNIELNVLHMNIRSLNAKCTQLCQLLQLVTGIAIACRLSVRPSVCLSVCNVGEL